MNKEQVLEFGFFNLARIESLKVDFRSRIGTALVRKNIPISIGRNKPKKTHPLIMKYDLYKTIHAEMDCIIGIDRHLVNNSTLYIYRERKDGTLASSKPCSTCMSFLKDLGVKKIYHTIDNGYELIKI